MRLVLELVIYRKKSFFIRKNRGNRDSRSNKDIGVIRMDKTITLNTGEKINLLGLGLYKLTDKDELKKLLPVALDLGYKLLDTAAFYGNEKDLAAAIEYNHLSHKEMFITTKVWNDAQREGRVREACEQSLKNLGVSELDMFMLHWPVADRFQQSWTVMEELHKEGKVRNIAVANFLEEQLEELLKVATIMPAMNQIERHPNLPQIELVKFCQDKGIAVQAHSTIMRGQLLDNKLLVSLAEKYNKTTTQIILRWDIQNQVAVIPKSSKVQRLRENSDIWNFELSEEDMKSIDALENGARCCADPANFDF